MDKSYLILALVCTVLIVSSCERKTVPIEPRTKILFDKDWKFNLGNVANAQQIDFEDTSWRNIELPHDWSIEDIEGTASPLDPAAIGSTNTGFFVGGTGWYRKKFTLPNESKGKAVLLYLEGVYMNSDVWINGHHLGNHPYGYTSFEYDLTPHIRFGQENTIAIEVKNEGKNSRWYSGSGIYRHVWLKILNPIHIETWGVSITTPEVNEDQALVEVKTQITGSAENQNITVVTSILNGNGEEVSSGQTKVENGNAVQRIEVKAPSLWSIDHPNMYTAIASVYDGTELIDKVTEPFGIRTISFSVDAGFLLNGESTLLKGGCMHHDNGPLGAAAYDRAEERRVELMKSNGFNAIRCAHNPPSEAFLAACDRLGVLVIDEAFDQWNIMKWDHKDDYSKYFKEWWKKDVHSMVKRDMNHPSIIMWSVGNEIPERAEVLGVETSKMLADEIKSIDTSRPITAGVNGLNSDKDPYFATLDISGLNYSVGGDHGVESIYEVDHERVPNRVMYCSESYPLHAYGSWKAVEKYPYVIGDFVWTSFDYLGEASLGWLGYWPDSTFYPWSHAFSGDLDICGFKRPQSYYRDVMWNQDKNPLSIWVHYPDSTFEKSNPNHQKWSKWHWPAVGSNWNWEGTEGAKYRVDVYSSSDSVELFLNNKSLGFKATDHSSELIGSWLVPYEVGELKAVAYKNKNKVGTTILKTASEVVQITLEADRSTLKPGIQDLSYVTVTGLDVEGVKNPNGNQMVSYSIEGPGEIIAVGSGNPRSTESYQQSKRKLFEGRGLVIVKALDQPGLIRLTAKSEGMVMTINLLVE